MKKRSVVLILIVSLLTLIIGSACASAAQNIEPEEIDFDSILDREYSHIVLLKGDGTVWSWGYNKFGQLGDGTTINRSTPVRVAGLTDITAVAMGGGHSVALKRDGTVWAWGYNKFGQLGDGTKEHRLTPVKVEGLSNVISISAGKTHTVAVEKDGTVWSWGSGSEYPQSILPTKVKNLSNVLSVSVGSDHTVILKKDGSVWVFGSNDYGQLGLFSNDGNEIFQLKQLKDITSISAGARHSLALQKDGTVWSWGDDDLGQLGNGNKPTIFSVYKIEGLSDVKSIAAGRFHSVALKEDGTVWHWGVKGDPGRYSHVDRPEMVGKIPEIVNGLTQIVSIDAVGKNTVAVKNDGTVWTYGNNMFGQLGNGKEAICTTPLQIDGLNKVVKLDTGNGLNIALDKDGAVWTWGVNEYGQIGNGTFISSEVPVKLKSLENIIDISAEDRHVIALRKDGTVWEWGLGKNTPEKVKGIDKVIGVAAGKNFSVGLLQNGTVWTWGSGEFGQLGRGVNNESEPSPVKGIDNIVSIAAGESHALALKKDGSVFGWGDFGIGQFYIERNRTGGSESDGQLSQIYDSYTDVPAKLKDLNRIICIAAGGNRSAFIDDSGHLTSTGNDTQHNVGAIAGNISGVKKAAVNDWNLAAIKDKGDLSVCGFNYYGQFGNGTLGLLYGSFYPGQSDWRDDILAGVKDVSASFVHVLALKEDGTVWVWGYREELNSNTPVMIQDFNVYK